MLTVSLALSFRVSLAGISPIMFSFSQFIMWNDIRNRSEELRQNHVVASLISGKLAGGAADVYEKEPLPDSSPLKDLKNVILTPHAAAQTEDAYYTCGMICAQTIVNVLNGGDPLFPVI